MTQESKRLREFRKSIGLTQAELSEQLGIKQDVISRYENGTYSIPLDVVKTLYKNHKLNYEWFFHGFGKPKVGEIAKATITTDLKEVLLENKILKEKVRVLENRLENLSKTVDSIRTEIHSL